MKCATKQNGNLVGMRHLLCPLHRRRGDADEISIEERIRQSVAGVLLTCGDHQGRSRNMRIQEVAQTVAESARRMEIKHARSASSLCVAVCHGNRTGLLQRQNIADIRRIDECVDQRQLGRSRVAKHVARALAPEHFKDDCCAAVLVPVIPSFCRHSALTILPCRCGAKIATVLGMPGYRPYTSRPPH